MVQWLQGLRKLALGLLIVGTVVLAGCGGSGSSTQQEPSPAATGSVEPAPPPPTTPLPNEIMAPGPPAIAPSTPGSDCGPGAGADKITVNGTKFTQDLLCLTQVSARYDASQNANQITVANLAPSGGGLMGFYLSFAWPQTDDVGLFFTFGETFIASSSATTSLCVYLVGWVNVTRHDTVGGKIEGNFEYDDIVGWCPVHAISGTFSIVRDPDHTSGEGTQQAPIPLELGAASLDGSIHTYGVSNYTFVATGTTHTVTIAPQRSDLSVLLFNHRPNGYDVSADGCHLGNKTGPQDCTFNNLKIGRTYYLWVTQGSLTSNHYQIAVN